MIVRERVARKLGGTKGSSWISHSPNYLFHLTLLFTHLFSPIWELTGAILNRHQDGKSVAMKGQFFWQKQNGLCIYVPQCSQILLLFCLYIQVSFSVSLILGFSPFTVSFNFDDRQHSTTGHIRLPKVSNNSWNTYNTHLYKSESVSCSVVSDSLQPLAL